MKIGILTFHGSHNYGSALQAYALSKQLSEMGHHVQIINLRNQAQKDAYSIFKKRPFSVRNLIFDGFTVMTYCSRKRRFRNFEQFINHILPITTEEYGSGEELRNAKFDFDAYVTGSDQVWNPSCQDFEPAYYLDFVDDSKLRVAYAPSLGKANHYKEDLALIQSLLKNMDSISCREEDGVKVLRQLTDKPVTHVCDPVILLDKKYWEEVAAEPLYKEHYILTYFLNNNHGDRSQVEYLRKMTGCRVIALNEYISDWLNPHVTLRIDVTPQQFVSLIKNATYVLTNSFHATAFSVIFERTFFTAIASQSEVHNNNDSRKIDFLKQFGLESRLMPNGTSPDVSEAIDYTKTRQLLSEFRQSSKNYLTQSLSR